MGTMLGTFTRTPSQANGLSIALGMVMGLLGGCMLPLEMFPPAVANAAKILPTTWAMMGMTQLTVYNAGLTQIFPYAAILLGFSLVFFVVGILEVPLRVGLVYARKQCAYWTCHPHTCDHKINHPVRADVVLLLYAR